jgi:hypothetical protein
MVVRLGNMSWSAIRTTTHVQRAGRQDGVSSGSLGSQGSYTRKCKTSSLSWTGYQNPPCDLQDLHPILSQGCASTPTKQVESRHIPVTLWDGGRINPMVTLISSTARSIGLIQTLLAEMSAGIAPEGSTRHEGARYECFDCLTPKWLRMLAAVHAFPWHPHMGVYP